MLDKVRLSKNVKLDPVKFSPKFYYKEYKKEAEVDLDTGEILREAYETQVYEYKAKSVYISYSPATETLRVVGRLIGHKYIETGNRLWNLDDYMRPKGKVVYHDLGWEERSDVWLCENAEYDFSTDELIFPEREIHLGYDVEVVLESIEDIISATENTLRRLTGVKFDLSTFNITYAEICFNVFLGAHTPSDYIRLFNYIHMVKKPKRYENYTISKGFDLGTSFYVKTKGDFKNNRRDNYVVNFYNKRDQLEKTKKRHGYKITDDELERASSVLRLEIQLAYKGLRKHLDRKTLKELLDVYVCREIIVKEYERFIGAEELDFYSYRALKERVADSKLSSQKKKALLDYLLAKAKTNKDYSYQTEVKHRKTLAEFGAHWFMIPKNMGIDYMKSPIKLLDQKIKQYEEERQAFAEDRLDVIPNEDFKSM